MIEKQRILMTRLLAGILCCIILFSNSAWETQAPLLSSLIFLAGLVLVAIATLGRLWCTLYIGGYKTRQLITVGPYSVSRHPLYFFSLMGGVGVGFASETLSIPAAIAVAFALYYPFVIRSEEKSCGKCIRKNLKPTPKQHLYFFQNYPF